VIIFGIAILISILSDAYFIAFEITSLVWPQNLVPLLSYHQAGKNTSNCLQGLPLLSYWLDEESCFFAACKTLVRFLFTVPRNNFVLISVMVIFAMFSLLFSSQFSLICQGVMHSTSCRATLFAR
jgi:hypothetical protein